jgi:hypothetical protein
LDIAKNVFQVHGIDAAEKVVVRKWLRRRQMLGFFKALPPCLIGMELGRYTMAGKILSRRGLIQEVPALGTATLMQRQSGAAITQRRARETVRDSGPGLNPESPEYPEMSTIGAS